MTLEILFAAKVRRRIRNSLPRDNHHRFGVLVV